MKICFIGKYPPIEGGVSTQTYWLAHGLANIGHQVHVVTNAFEVEERFRISCECDSENYQFSENPSGGSIHVYDPMPYTGRRMFHIPQSNPFITKLAAVATNVIRDQSCEVIYAHYYEPYLMAAWLAGQWTGIPVIAKHAGSDLDRLFQVEDIGPAYVEILKRTSAIATWPHLMDRFLAMGVEQQQLVSKIPYSIPSQVFNPAANPIDLLAFDTNGIIFRSSTVEQKIDVPVIGVYGKIGEFKGTYDLIEALGVLRKEGREFIFAAMIGKDQENQLNVTLAKANILDRSIILPFLPNWKVPSFIRACTAVCFLERDFPIAIHGPIMPREVLACGTSLLLSSEIFEKQHFKDDIKDGKNAYIVKDPKNISELSGIIRYVIDNAGKAIHVGQCGYQLSQSIENFDNYISGWERIFHNLVKKPHDNCSNSRGVYSPKTNSRQLLMARDFLAPIVCRIVDTELGTGFNLESKQDQKSNPLREALQICEEAQNQLIAKNRTWTRSVKLNSLKYQMLKLNVQISSCNKHRSPFVAADRAVNGSLNRETIWNLRPLKSQWSIIHEFDLDMSEIISTESDLTNSAIDLSCPDWAKDFPEKKSFVIFLCLPNFSTRELKIDSSVVDLLELCNGEKNTAEIVSYFAQTSNKEDSDADAEISDSTVNALKHLYSFRAIVFGEWRDGIGWLGGAR